MLILPHVALAIGLLADGVLAGSRLWEAKLPSERTNNTLLSKRAVSFQPGDGPNDVRLWPKKTIKWCFDDESPPDVLKGLWHEAREKWKELEGKGFKYEQVSRSVCNSNRANVLRVHYNSVGRLSSTVGVQPIDEKWNRENPDDQYLGPFTHLSDMEGIGQLDINANAAHELGHVWGLYHEHQNRKWWKTSTEHFFSEDPKWEIYNSQRAKFQTNKFDCTALKDYEAVREKVLAAVEEDPVENADDEKRFCSWHSIALKYRFSAAEWLPLAGGYKVLDDPEFDPDSLMMYPSGAGGKGSGESRQPVLKYTDGAEIPVRIAPTSMDINRLATLYESEKKTPAMTHLASSMKNTLKKARSKILRGGDTSQGLC